MANLSKSLVPIWAVPILRIFATSGRDVPLRQLHQVAHMHRYDRSVGVLTMKVTTKEEEYDQLETALGVYAEIEVYQVRTEVQPATYITIVTPPSSSLGGVILKHRVYLSVDGNMTIVEKVGQALEWRTLSRSTWEHIAAVLELPWTEA